MTEVDQGRWLSYRELGDVLGCTANAARMHAVRRGWTRRAPNRIGDCARVLVPDDVAVRPRITHVAEQCDAQCNEHPNGAVQANGRAAFDAQAVLVMVRETVETLMAPLREQLAAERDRADRERERADQAERHLAELQARPPRSWWPWRRS